MALQLGDPYETKDHDICVNDNPEKGYISEFQPEISPNAVGYMAIQII